MTAPSDIPPPRRDVPRYLPGRRFPAYRYVPNLHPHPTRDPRGHSYADPAAADQTERTHRPQRRQSSSAAPTGDWRTAESWLWGVDLFNHFYFWEAHEAWESLWRRSDGDPKLLLQGLIQTAAALLKIHLGSATAAARLSEAAIEKLNRVSRRRPHLMGLDVAETQRQMRNYFRPLASQALPSLDGAPILRLAAERTPGERP